MDDPFWIYLDQLAKTSDFVIDRTKGTNHPRYTDVVYPLDYGYLAGTTSGDCGGIDVWRGSLQLPILQGVALTVDLAKRDAEIKILIGCTPDEIDKIHAFMNNGDMKAMVLLKKPLESEASK